LGRADVLAITPDDRWLVIQAKRHTPGNMVTGPDLQKGRRHVHPPLLQVMPAKSHTWSTTSASATPL